VITQSPVRDALSSLTRACDVRGGWRYAPVLNRLFTAQKTTIRLPGVGLCLLDLEDEDQLQIYWAGLDRADRHIMRLVRDLLPRDGVFLDIGANIGIHTLAAARHLKPGGGKVVAFEPHPENYKVLVHNLHENSLTNVRPERVGLADARKTLAVCGSPQSGNWSMASTGALRFDVDLLPLDEYLEQQPVERIDVIKMDIEGSEVWALTGARSSLRRYRPTIIFEVNPHWLRRVGTSVTDLFATLDELDYGAHHLPQRGTEPGPSLLAGDLAGMSDENWINLVAYPREGRGGRS
jgi:FkbM family methyltransferase